MTDSGPDLTTMPAAGASAEEWSAWRAELRRRQEAALAVEKERLMGLGLIDAEWRVTTDAVPDDMLPGSDSSVET